MPELIKALKPKTPKKISRPRKYATYSSKWRRIRRAQLNKQPLCEHCKEAGRTTPAKAVDHIDGDSWNNEAHNLASLCTRCHTIKTNKYDGGLGRKRHDQG